MQFRKEGARVITDDRRAEQAALKKDQQSRPPVGTNTVTPSKFLQTMEWNRGTLLETPAAAGRYAESDSKYKSNTKGNAHLQKRQTGDACVRRDGFVNRRQQRGCLLQVPRRLVRYGSTGWDLRRGRRYRAIRKT